MTERSLTMAAAEFAANLKYEDIPADALHIGRRCILDGLAVMIGGTEQPALEVLDKYINKVGGTGDSRLVGNAGKKVPAHLAAMWNGLAGHAMDWDDTQLAAGPGRNDEFDEPYRIGRDGGLGVKIELRKGECCHHSEEGKAKQFHAVRKIG